MPYRGARAGFAAPSSPNSKETPLANPQLDEKLQQRVRELSQQNPSWSSGQIQKTIQDETGKRISRDCIIRYRAPKVVTVDVPSESNEITGDTWSISLPRRASVRSSNSSSTARSIPKFGKSSDSSATSGRWPTRTGPTKARSCRYSKSRRF
jgi:hypothetical protein